MSDNIDIKKVALVGLGLVIAFSAYSVLSIQKKVDDHNNQLMMIAESKTDDE